MRKWGKKKVMIVILIVVLVIAAGFGGYCIYGMYKINELSRMTYKEMLDYTTKDKKDAVITVGIIQKGKMTYHVYGGNGQNQMHICQQVHYYPILQI